MCARENGHVFLAKNFFDDSSSFALLLFENVRTALNQSDPRAKTAEELREFDSHRATAQNDQRFGQVIQRERFVAGDVSNFIEGFEWRWGDPGAGANHKVFRGQFFAVIQFDGMR